MKLRERWRRNEILEASGWVPTSCSCPRFQTGQSHVRTMQKSEKLHKIGRCGLCSHGRAQRACKTHHISPYCHPAGHRWHRCRRQTAWACSHTALQNRGWHTFPAKGQIVNSLDYGLCCYSPVPLGQESGHRQHDGYVLITIYGHRHLNFISFSMS